MNRQVPTQSGEFAPIPVCLEEQNVSGPISIDPKQRYSVSVEPESNGIVSFYLYIEQSNSGKRWGARKLINCIETDEYQIFNLDPIGATMLRFVLKGTPINGASTKASIWVGGL